MDLRWTWNHGGDELWRRLYPMLWALTYHPSTVLQTVSREKLSRALADPDFCRLLDRLVQAKRQAATMPRWFQQKYPQTSLTCVAYFCMEYMLSEALRRNGWRRGAGCDCAHNFNFVRILWLRGVAFMASRGSRCAGFFLRRRR